MKKILYLFLLLLPVLGFAQSRYGVEGVPMCWRTPLGVDSSLNRYVIISTTGKPVQTIVYENANGVVVTVAGGSMRYGYCDCIDFTVPNSSVTWEMLTQPVKDSIRHKRDTFITVPPSTNYFQNTIDNPAKFYNNIHFSCKGRTDTSIVAFLGAPVWEEQKGVVYHIKNDSGLVAAFILTNGHLSNSKIFYLLQRGQTAQVRLLPDAANGGNYGWAVNVVWDSIGGGGSTIYTASDSIRNGNRLLKMARDGSQAFAVGYWPIFPSRGYDYNNEYGLYISKTNGEVSLQGKQSWIGLYDMFAGIYANRDKQLINIGGNNRNIVLKSATQLSTSVWHDMRLDSAGTYVGKNGALYKLLPTYDVSRPSTTSNVTNILKWVGDGSKVLPVFGYRYETDTLVGNVYLKSPNIENFVEQTVAIGNFPTFPFYSVAQSKQGLLLSPYNYGTNSLMMFFSGLGTTVDIGNSAGHIRNFKGTKETARVGVQPNVVLLQARPLSAPTTFATLKLDSTAIKYDPLGGNEFVILPNANPPTASGAISTNIWIAGTPSFLRSQHKTISGTTDGSGDITITFDAAMPDATYTVIVTGQETTPYVYMTQSATLATGSVKVRMFTLAGSAATSTAYQISYEVKDTN